jgi:hypothetical protein
VVGGFADKHKEPPAISGALREPLSQSISGVGPVLCFPREQFRTDRIVTVLHSIVESLGLIECDEQHAQSLTGESQYSLALNGAATLGLQPPKKSFPKMESERGVPPRMSQGGWMMAA